jgi:transcriptional regulator with XRE-family HTH domain
MNELGKELKRAREEAGVSQMAMAKAMGYASSQLISNWERGRCSIPPKKGYIFCKMTGMKRATFENMLIEHAANSIRYEVSAGRFKDRNKDLSR